MASKMILLCSMLIARALTVGAQPVIVEVASVPAVTGEVVGVPILARNFTDIASFQFSLSWDTSKTVLVGIADWQVAGAVAGLDAGRASFSWFSADGQGVTLADGASLARLSFLVKACPGDSARIVFDTAQVSIEFTQVNGGQLQAVPAEVIPSRLAFRSPALLPVQDTFFCAPGAISIEAGCAGCIRFLWSDGNLSPANTFESAGHYAVTAENADGCIFSDSLFLEADTFGLPALPDTAVCPETSLTITAQAGFTHYIWSTGDTLPAVQVSGPGEYAVTVVNDRGCTAADTVKVEEAGLPLAHVFADPSGLCPGDSARLYADVTDVETITWLDAGGSLLLQGAEMMVVAPDSSTFFLLAARNACGADTVQTEVSVIHFEAGAGADTCIAKGSSLQLNAGGGTAYHWFGSEYPVEDPDIPNPAVQPEDSTFFIVEITGPGGCTITDTVHVAVADGPLATIKPINLITPNGDGKNDALYFPGLGKFARNRLSVWNRWGVLVFHAEGYQLSDGELWEGTHNGKPLPEGDYYYALDVDGQVLRQHLMIIRE
ncbi:MAG: gliding motility-associated C-terminal domain-containing protein [Phaeodactylibacter sp.]|nr:gliding motility-associated C-terminal domain-containing protein [Phaeodactylibacter sp.]